MTLLETNLQNMKRLLFLSLLIIFALHLNASAQTIDLKVKGVEIGTSYSSVLEKLGKPLSSKVGGIVPCSDGSKLLTVRYQGLVIELSKDVDETNFTVFSMTVTSPRWSMSGINIGADIKNVRTKYGSSKLIKDEGMDSLIYYITDGFATFYFRNKKLVKVRWEFNFC